MEPIGWHTHYPVLAACLALQPTGPVLEIGCGDWSTALLHMMCGAQGRQLVTIESDEAWLNKYRYMERPWHHMLYAPDIDIARIIDDTAWGVAFVDHEPWQIPCRSA